ncbi:hypothetical protein H2203_001015 [Taxawa tesnikishii (nom. ined.)]|nr:hypothetical protein H2203_001015 [Dothideales sp. JES 119]
MRDFVGYVHDTDKVAMQDFWRQELKGAVGPQFPRTPSRDFLPTPDAMLERQIPLETSAGSPFTLATIIRGAWALVASQYTGSDDVVFGETLTGRDVSLPGVESIVGPLIATVPVRIRINRTSSVESYLQTVQQGMLVRTPYQHMGWQNIRKVSEDAQRASEAPMGLVIQPEPEYAGDDLGFEHGDVVREALHFNPYPLMLACGIRKGRLRVCTNFDSSLIAVTQMERILAQLEVACLQLTGGLSRQIDEISCLPEAELNQIWQWNQIPHWPWTSLEGFERTQAPSKDRSTLPLCVLPVRGHIVDLTDLEAHISKHLPPTTRAAAAVSQFPTNGNQQVLEQGLVVFIEQPHSTEDSVALMSEQRDVIGVMLCTSISEDLAAALQKLDRFIHDSLPSYMVPSAYVVVDKMPIETGQIDRNALSQLASEIPRHVLTQLLKGLKEAWTKSSVQKKLTTTEEILRSAWATVLGMRSEQIDVDDNFFRLGGDSVLAMKLVSSLRCQGHGLTVADIFQHMRLSDAAKVLKTNNVSRGKKAQPYKPFGTLGNMDKNTFLSEIVRPKLADPCWSVRDVLPVTHAQALDIEGTIQAPRTSVQYTMLYFGKGVYREQLLRACNDLVRTHGILRTAFIESESGFLQVVLNELEAPVQTQHVDDFLGTPFFKMFYVEGENGEGCLIIRLSHAQYDGVSLPMLLRDLEVSYTGQQIINFEPYTSYVARILDESGQGSALTYWRDLLNGSSLSMLVGTSAPPTDKSLFKAKPVDITQCFQEITTANLLTAAWALLLARRLWITDVTFGNVTSGRNLDLANAENVMGPCYQFTPVRVPFEAHWTSIDLCNSYRDKPPSLRHTTSSALTKSPSSARSGLRRDGPWTLSSIIRSPRRISTPCLSQVDLAGWIS